MMAATGATGIEMHKHFHAPKPPELGGNLLSYGWIWCDVMQAGLLHFIGRKDRQIKSRGFRVELTKSKRHCVNHPAVEEAAVHPTSPKMAIGGGHRRCRYAATKPYRRRNNVEPLMCARRWPTPGSIVVVTSFPRTTSGRLTQSAAKRRNHTIYCLRPRLQDQQTLHRLYNWTNC